MLQFKYSIKKIACGENQRPLEENQEGRRKLPLLSR
jgi:hypothetical protein